ncbi:type II toxin-antitoxin system RelE/ParE family toxin [Bosea sp. (in: a-proteobacteria)]|uniref:type II toxin-antitoxin system RelE/ParE family toxin n=1 Tax=Bosea sp. (in: a-proteobacteria) TaxID=1871050 RepID=UPI0025BD5179|nr:type II toxin-antitoxin system RelE/ParE family toxin [Bosea sp. (in: a-proteobacteria)]WRH58975.1 MAG: type II toxin-antitoxin system RelE/ParE family toxin [Bosea sp. (in: a-proteobacteria)]
MAKFEIIVRPAAQQDLKEIYDWIADHASEATAIRFIRRIQSGYASLSDYPQRGTRREGLMTGLRTFGIDRRVTVAFRIDGQEVVILRILYGGRDLERAVRQNGDQKPET